MQEKQFNQQILVHSNFLEAFALKLTADSEKAKDLFRKGAFAQQERKANQQKAAEGIGSIAEGEISKLASAR